MEELGNYKIIFYIILAILYFLFTGRKKSKAASPSQNKPPIQKEETKPYAPPVSTKPKKPLLSRPLKTVGQPVKEQEPLKPQPVSLDDMLREFRKVQEEKKELYHDEPSSKVVDYDENLIDEEILADQKIKNDLAARPSEEIIFDKDEHFSAYALDAKKENPYAKMLKDPKGIKIAIIASEIFNRKY